MEGVALLKEYNYRINLPNLFRCKYTQILANKRIFCGKDQVVLKDFLTREAARCHP